MKLSRRQEVRLAAQNELLRLLAPPEGFSILDLGTEFGHTGRWIRKDFPSAIITGVEIHEDTFWAMDKSPYSRVHLGDAVGFLKTHGLWDVVVAAELVEHLPKEEGHELLDLLKVNAGIAIVTSPIGFHPQGKLYGNPHQVHLSGWTDEEMRKLGWATWVLRTDFACSLGIWWHRR